MNNTVAEVYTRARDLVNDSAAQVFTDADLLQSFNQAYTVLWRAMEVHGCATVTREAYLSVPAYTTGIDPKANAITDLGELLSIQERLATTAVNVSAVSTAAVNLITTSSPHGLATNSDAIVAGVLGTGIAPNGRWFVTAVSASTLTLNGYAQASAFAYSSGGTVSPSTGSFTPVYPVSEISDDASPGDALGEYVWNGDMLRFAGATTARLLKLSYYSSGAPPASGSLGIDDALDFLGCYTAALAMLRKNGVARGGQLIQAALGPQSMTNGSGGILGEFIRLKVRDLQRITYRHQPFRRRRNMEPLGVTGGGRISVPTVDPSLVNYSDNELPGGTLNGVNLIFTLAHSPLPASSLRLYLNGVLQHLITDYTLIGNQVTMLSAPLVTDTFVAFYRYAP